MGSLKYGVLDGVTSITKYCKSDISEVKELIDRENDEELFEIPGDCHGVLV